MPSIDKLRHNIRYAVSLSAFSPNLIHRIRYFFLYTVTFRDYSTNIFRLDYLIFSSITLQIHHLLIRLFLFLILPDSRYLLLPAPESFLRFHYLPGYFW